MFLPSQSADRSLMRANTIKNRPNNDKTSILSQEIIKILDNRFQHKNTPIKTNSLSNLGVPELEYIYKYLVSGVITYQEGNSKQRPKCPVISPCHQSLANMQYKKDMIEYLSNFNIKLCCYIGTYKASILEALANYCEHTVKKSHKNS